MTFKAREHRATECQNKKPRPSMVVRQAGSVFVSHGVSRHAGIVE